ncbi:ribonuclease T2 family protein [Sulfitobacter delicatus]|uniref:Ribonuclease T2 n=1 Tax=Sulfitobacter delicatus TaxID=218672 RepID=A0A1G7HN96_9RHOB|nr:ribonuclease T2 [Sulfitobacter delicatus]SDF01479.1 ribonuclease T2 [Sulfitobacter delicatus]
MQPLRACLLTLSLLTPFATHAEGERAGEFDYYVMSLSWSPNWCELTGDARRSPQCADDTGHGWTLHGLWPQYTRGYPSYCQSGLRPPSRAQTGAMADIMGTGGLAWHQWKKHGSCTGLGPADYFALSREAYGRVIRPEVFRKLDRDVALPASVVEEAFLKANPRLKPEGITITCKQDHIQEARICLSRTLEFIPCGPDVRRDCTLEDALFTPLR